MIILYSTGCPKCKILKKLLENSSIEYVENNNEKEMESLGLNSLPAIKLEDNRVLNYQESVKYIKEGR